jgi:hypothetical protein
MAFGYLSPNWFFGLDIAFELVFGLIALLLALFAIKLSKLTSENSVELFGKGFLLISIAYFFQAAFNFLMLAQFSDGFVTISDFSLAILLRLIGAYGFMILMVTGLLVLLYMTFDLRKPRVLAVMVLLGTIPLTLVENPLPVFYFISMVCFAFVAWHFILNYVNHKKRLNLFTAVAFLLMLFGSIHFFLSINPQWHDFLYVLGHLSVLAAYLLILINFYMVLKK